MNVHSILIVPLFALSLSALAQTAPPTDPNPADAATAAPPHHAGGKQKFIAADSNGDGKLSRDEAQVLPHIAKHFDDIDSNHDGYITREELRVAHKRMEAVRAQRQSQPPGDQRIPPPAEGDDGSH